VHLHNRLLISLLHNASAAPPTAAQALSRKRKRVGVDDPEFDIDDTYIEPRARVHHWVVGMSSRERARVRRVVMGRGPVPEVDGAGEDEDSPEWDARKRRWSLFQPSERRRLDSRCIC
jgi:transcriptional coactivator HFI1/ADA1